MNHPDAYKKTREKVISKIWFAGTNKNKGYSCCICGFDRAVDLAHIVPRRDGGKVEKDNIYILCPNHHRVFDRGLLTTDEKTRLKSVSALELKGN